MDENSKSHRPSRPWLPWLSRIVAMLACACAVLLPLVILAVPGMRPGPLRVSVEASTAWLVVVTALSSLVLLYIAWRMVRAFLLYPLGSWQVFGATTSARLVALGITTLLASKGITALVIAPVNFLLQLADRLPRLATRIAITDTAIAKKDATDSIKQPVFQLSIIVQDMVGELGSAFAKAFDTLPIPETVLALACWAILGNLLSSAMADGDASGGAGRSRLLRYLQALSSAQRYAIVLTTVFLFGAYLSIAAIVAIPWLHEEHVSPALTRESLEKTLDGLLPTAAQLEERTRLPPAGDKPLAPLAEYLATAPKPAGTSGPYLMGALNAAIAEADNVRATAISQVQRMLSDAVQQAARIKQVALGAFDLETASPMSAQERGFFVREIQRSVASDVAALESTLANCAGTLGDTDKRLREIAQGTRMVLAAQPLPVPQPQAQAETRDPPQLMLLAQVTGQVSAASRNLRDACDVHITARTSAYAAPEPGSTWGPFGLVARWLLRTKSLALTLITGMLGFGLLGSVISTFVRGGAGKEGVSLTSEVISVLVRGLSAAVVVFLAVKGGLAVFSSPDTEPNAYVVFFTCLIGAVFSEDVWKWAHGKFLENLRARQDPASRSQSMADTISKGPDSSGPGQDDQR